MCPWRDKVFRGYLPCTQWDWTRSHRVRRPNDQPQTQDRDTRASSWKQHLSACCRCSVSQEIWNNILISVICWTLTAPWRVKLLSLKRQRYFYEKLPLSKTSCSLTFVVCLFFCLFILVYESNFRWFMCSWLRSEVCQQAAVSHLTAACRCIIHTSNEQCVLASW